MEDHWDLYIKELQSKNIPIDRVLNDIQELISKENKEIGHIHSLSDRVHILHNSSMHLLFEEGIFEAQEIMDWTIEMIEILEEENDKALHFVLELEAAEKEGKRWITKHHDKIISEIKLEELDEKHFLKRVMKKLKELEEMFNSIKENLDEKDKKRFKLLIDSLSKD